VRYDAPSSAADIPGFIKDYGVDTSECDPVESFKTLNDFFSRRLKPGARPMYNEAGVQAILSPCDCRLHAWTDVDTAKRIGIKGEHFSLESLIGGARALSEAKVDPAEFNKGSFVVCRLAPTDYHRVHAPFDCVVAKRVDFGGKLNSVKTYCVESPVDVLTENKRVTLFLRSPVFGEVAFVFVGATYVGSIDLFVKDGDEVKAGAEIGTFRYGGSTVVMVFKPGQAKFDNDLIQNSDKRIETYVKLHTRIGTKG